MLSGLKHNEHLSFGCGTHTHLTYRTLTPHIQFNSEKTFLDICSLRFISHTNDFFVFVTETIRQNNSIYLIHFYKPSTFFFSSSSCIDARVWRLKYVFFFFICCCSNSSSNSSSSIVIVNFLSKKKTEKNTMWFFPCTWTTEWNRRKKNKFGFFGKWNACMTACEWSSLSLFNHFTALLH